MYPGRYTESTVSCEPYVLIIYFLSSNGTDCVGEAPFDRCDPRTMIQLIHGIHISVIIYICNFSSLKL
jgi:hypothetical protein